MNALEMLAFGPSTVTRVAAELQVHPRTARRLLSRMAEDGWLTRTDGARPVYTPTLRIVALAAQFADRAPLVRHATEVARELRKRVDGTVHLATPSYRSALRLVRVDGPDRAYALRDLAPAHAIAAGKLLLACRQPWSDVVLGFPLDAVTANTVVEPVRLRAELEKSHERGYAVEDEEYRVGTRALAVPVRLDGEVTAALAVSSRTATVSELLQEYDAIAGAAEDLSTRIASEAA